MSNGVLNRTFTVKRQFDFRNNVVLCYIRFFVREWYFVTYDKSQPRQTFSTRVDKNDTNSRHVIWIFTFFPYICIRMIQHGGTLVWNEPALKNIVTMVENLKRYIEEEKLFDPKQKILLAVSGGIDSVVLCDLFYRGGYNFSIAHCNFHLRGEESNRDERFVRNLADRYAVRCYVKQFETQKYVQEQHVSTQMAARTIRYEWFEELLDEEDFAFCATAHHRDDSIETLLINLLRGTGIAGLHGILPKRDRFIHPLLFAGRQDIACYAEENKLQHVEDSTNASTKYMRNRIRLEVIPLLKEIAPGFDRIISKEINRFRETEIIFRSVVDKMKEDICENKGDYVKISLQKLNQTKPTKIYLYEILYDYGFNEAVVTSIYENLNEESGKQFFSPTHRCVKDRNYLLITPLDRQNSAQEYEIESTQTSIQYPLNIHIEALMDVPFIRIDKDKNIATLDYDRLKFPLVLRKWKQGDYFFPFGMNGKKMISDFYTNLKYSLVDKENRWLLCSGDDIVWVVGERIDDRFKITKDSKSVYRMELDDE